MLEKTELAVLFPTYNDLETIRRTLPTVIEDCKAVDARVLIHDCSTRDRDEIWAFLREVEQEHGAILVLTTRMSMADSRNMLLSLAMSLFAPNYICMLEDDHGFRPGMTAALIAAMKTHYGQRSPNGLVYGLFTGCRQCWHFHEHHVDSDGNAYPDPSLPTFALGGANSCFRAAPTSHWISVLKGYDPDENFISSFQTRNLNYRNYHNGFTSMAVADGRYGFAIDRQGQGYTQDATARGWDEEYTRSDPRSRQKT